MRHTLSALLTLLALIALGVAAIAILAWANWQWVSCLFPKNEFLYRWEITRSLIFGQANPYDTLEPRRFTAPLPILTLYFPFALIQNYHLALTLWVTFSQVAALIFASLGIRSTGWQINRWAAGAMSLLAVFWFPAMIIYAQGSEAILMAAFFGGGLLLLQRKQDEIAGVLITLSALQWYLTWPGVLFVLLWAASRRRWRFYFWGAATFLGTSLLGMIFIPSWPVDFFWAALRYTDFQIGQAVLNITTGWWPGIGRQIGWGIVLFGGIILMAEWYLAWGRDSRHLAWTAALTWVLALWIGIEVSIQNAFLLLAALLIIFTTWVARWGRAGLAVSFGTAALLLVVPWWRASAPGTPLPLLTLGFPLLAMIGLYWVRWWFLRAEDLGF